jgi:hypothetical protein
VPSEKCFGNFRVFKTEIGMKDIKYTKTKDVRLWGGSPEDDLSASHVELELINLIASPTIDAECSVTSRDDG